MRTRKVNVINDQAKTVHIINERNLEMKSKRITASILGCIKLLTKKNYSYQKHFDKSFTENNYCKKKVFIEKILIDLID